MRSGLRLPWQPYTADRKLQLVGFRCSEYFPKPVIPPRESCTAKALLGLLSFSNTACTSFMTLHLPKMKSKNFHSSSVGQRKLWGQEKFFSINLLSFHGFIAPLLTPCLFRNLCVSINILAGRLDSKERLFRTDCFPLAIKKEKMDLADLCSFF